MHARRQPFGTPAARVYALAAAVAVAAAGLQAVLPGGAPAVDVPVAWLLLVVAFGVAELVMFNVQLRRESVSLSISTIPLVVGLFVAEPSALITARLLGAGVALLCLRRQPGIKAASNLAMLWLETGLVIAVFQRLSFGEVGVGGWPGTFVAVLAGDVASCLVLAGLISAFHGCWQRGVLAAQGPSALNSVVDTSVGLITVTLLAHEPAAVALLGVVLAMVIVSYRIHTSLRDRHRDLASLYRVTADMADAVLHGRVVSTALQSARDLLHGEEAWLYVQGPDGLERLALEGELVGATPVAAGSPDAALHDAAQRAAEPIVASPRTARSHLAADLGVRDLLAAGLRGEAEGAATLVVAERSSESRRFGQEDVALFATVANHVAVAMANDRLVDRLRDHAAASEHQSLHDALTGLPNRTLFGRELARHLAEGRPAAVLLLDLDRFKEVNDTLGHHHGDLLLLQVAERLRTSVRRTDVVARLGGDEFAVLLPDVPDAVSAREAALAIAAALLRPIEVADVAVDVGASIGVALAPEHGDEVGALLQRADVAMYTAKADQSVVEVYEHERDGHSRERLSMVGELRAAIAAGELEVHFQPLLDLGSQLPVGAEALVRWFHPTRGPVAPDELVQVAEQSGLIRPLTDLVLERALAACASWRARGWDLRVSVNLSARSLLQPTVVADVACALARAGLPASALCLELTETSIMADPRRTVAALEDLAGLGVTIAVDDFGTGHSSLAYLKKLPVGEIKIDRSFVKSMADEAGDRAIVQSIVDLAANLRLPVVAEGIEEPALGGLLRAMGCDLGQGYGYARPMPDGDLTLWLAERLRRPVAVA